MLAGVADMTPGLLAVGHEQRTLEGNHMDKTYETPSITELGSVADFTRGSGSGPQWDGIFDIFSGAPRPGGGHGS